MWKKIKLFHFYHSFSVYLDPNSQRLSKNILKKQFAGWSSARRRSAWNSPQLTPLRLKQCTSSCCFGSASAAIKSQFCCEAPEGWLRVTECEAEIITQSARLPAAVEWTLWSIISTINHLSCQTYRWCSSWVSSWTPSPCSWDWTPGIWWWIWCPSQACCSWPVHSDRVQYCSSPPALSSPGTACSTHNLFLGPLWDRWCPVCLRCQGRSLGPFRQETWQTRKEVLVTTS